MLQLQAAAEQEASIKLAEASRNISANPAALELRRLQMLTEIGTENNTTTIVMMPSDFINLANRLSNGAGNSGTTDLQPFNPEVLLQAKNAEKIE